MIHDLDPAATDLEGALVSRDVVVGYRAAADAPLRQPDGVAVRARTSRQSLSAVAKDGLMGAAGGDNRSIVEKETGNLRSPDDRRGDAPEPFWKLGRRRCSVRSDGRLTPSSALGRATTAISITTISSFDSAVTKVYRYSRPSHRADCVPQGLASLGRPRCILWTSPRLSLVEPQRWRLHEFARGTLQASTTGTCRKHIRCSISGTRDALAHERRTGRCTVLPTSAFWWSTSAAAGRGANEAHRRAQTRFVTSCS